MTGKYRAKRPFFIAYLLFLLLGLLLTLGRWYGVFQEGFVIWNAEVHSHLSNFSLSMILYMGIGYSWLLYGRKFGAVVVLGVLLIAGNVVCETWMGFLNTPDIMDAVYGAVGVLAAYGYLFALNRYGLEERPPRKA